MNKQMKKHLGQYQPTIYSDGAINSIVADLISGLRCGSPYVFDAGSKENSSGTEIYKCSSKHAKLI